MRQELAERKRALAAAALFTLAVVAVAATPQLLGSQVSQAFGRLADARPVIVCGGIGALLVVVTLVAWAQAWRSMIRSCGGDAGRVDSCARYAVGSGINTFVPARLGERAIK